MDKADSELMIFIQSGIGIQRPTKASFFTVTATKQK
jgi:hypothetical protein